MGSSTLVSFEACFWKFWGHTWKSIAAKTGNSHGVGPGSHLEIHVCLNHEYCRDGCGLRCLCWMHSFRSYHVASLIPRKDVGCGFVVEVRGSLKALITRCKQLWYDSRGHWDRFHVLCSGVAWSEWGMWEKKRRDLIIVLWFVFDRLFSFFVQCI